VFFIFNKQQSIGGTNQLAATKAAKQVVASNAAITLIWQYILDIWRLRNDDLHSSQLQHVTLNALEQHVQQFIHQIQTDPILQSVAPSITMAQLLRRSPWAIQEWAHTTRLNVQQYLLAAQQRARLCTQDIRQFLINLQPSSVP